MIAQFSLPKKSPQRETLRAFYFVTDQDLALRSAASLITVSATLLGHGR